MIAQVLTDEQIARIHDASLRILERTGVVVPHEDMLVLQEEVISYVESALREIDFSDDALGLDVIDRASSRGTFIDTANTVEHFRKELWTPTLLDRQFYQAWKDGGADDVQQRCRRRKQEILDSHEVEPISAELDKAISEIVSAARRELAAK